MEMLLPMVLPSLILPLILSFGLWWGIQSYPAAQWGLPVIWLPSYIWLIGLPTSFPGEAIEWLWGLVVVSTLISIVFRSRLLLCAIFQMALLVLVLAAVAYPVLRYEPSMLLVVESVVVIACYGIISYLVRARATTPALSMAISSGGLALGVALGGSVVVGQLAGALASILGVFAFREILHKLQKPAVSSASILTVVQLYLVILVTARFFAEIPLGPSILLLVAPLAGLALKMRYAFVLSLASVISALAWLMLLADSSSYY